MKSLEDYLAERDAAAVDWAEENTRAIEEYRHKRDLERYKQYHNVYRTTIHGRARTMLGACKARAKAKGLDFDLDAAWIEERLRQPCPKTGVQFKLQVGLKRKQWNSPSLDRIDNTKGYTKDNCQIVVDMYNMCKSWYHEDQVLTFAQAVINTANAVESEESHDAV